MKQVIFMASYDKKEYEKIRNNMDDRENMDDSWDEWFFSKEDSKLKLTLQGFRVIEILISLEFI